MLEAGRVGMSVGWERMHMDRRKVVLVLLAAVLIGAVGVSVVLAASTSRFASLNGENELNPTTGEPGAGDLNGIGRAEIKIDMERERACFDLGWRRIASPTRAHIHEGDRNTNGGIVVFLFENSPAPGTFEPLPVQLRRVHGCERDVDPALLEDIRQHPAQYYVNIHNEDFPAGAIRGQLRRR
jgi:CHRD domain